MGHLILDFGFWIADCGFWIADYMKPKVQAAGSIR
jgi:hypothetical protein